MATEFKLDYSGSEINRKLADVDVIKVNLKDNYYTSTDIDNKFNEINENINLLTSALSNAIGSGVLV